MSNSRIKEKEICDKNFQVAPNLCKDNSPYKIIHYIRLEGKVILAANDYSAAQSICPLSAIIKPSGTYTNDCIGC